MWREAAELSLTRLSLMTAFSSGLTSWILSMYACTTSTLDTWGGMFSSFLVKTHTGGGLGHPYNFTESQSESINICRYVFCECFKALATSEAPQQMEMIFLNKQNKKTTTTFPVVLLKCLHWHVVACRRQGGDCVVLLFEQCLCLY